jgi:hypothetical protein
MFEEKMLSKIEHWMASGAAKLAFLAGKDYSVAKFNCWLAKWKASQGNETTAGFMEIGLIQFPAFSLFNQIS